MYTKLVLFDIINFTLGEQMINNVDFKQINDLIISVKLKQKGAVESLHKAFSPRLYYIALKYFKGDTAQEFIQDFWANIQTICAKWRIHSHGLGYLIKVAENKAKTRLKRDKLKTSRETCVSVEIMANLAVSSTSIEEQERRDMITRAFLVLDELERKIILETFYACKTIREIARQNDLSKSTAERIKQTALEKMRVFLSK